MTQANEKLNFKFSEHRSGNSATIKFNHGGYNYSVVIQEDKKNIEKFKRLFDKLNENNTLRYKAEFYEDIEDVQVCDLSFDYYSKGSVIPENFKTTFIGTKTNSKCVIL